MPSTVEPVTEGQPEKRTRRSIVRSWFGQESFWRDVATRTIAAAIVGVGAYLYALGAGYVSSPTGSQTLRGVWNVAITAIVGTIIGSAMIWGPIVFNPKRYETQPRWVQRSVKVIEWVCAIFVGLAVFHVLTGVFNDVWWAWPFNTPLFRIPVANEPH